RDLVVARAPRVQLAADLADHLQQAALDVHVDVLELGTERERAGLQLPPHRREPAHDAIALGVGEQSGPGEGPGPGDAAGDVVGPEPAIEGEGAREARRGGIGSGAEPGPRQRLVGGAHGSSAAMSSMIRWVTRPRASRPGLASWATCRGRPKRTASGWRRGM